MRSICLEHILKQVTINGTNPVYAEQYAQITPDLTKCIRIIENDLSWPIYIIN